MYLQGPLENKRWGLFRAKRMNVKEPWGKPQPLERANEVLTALRAGAIVGAAALVP